MSELGQSRRFDAPPTTSGQPQSTDIGRPARLVRFVPITDIQKQSLDHFVCLSRSIGGTMIPTSCLFAMM
jgi:hypothetical protein